MGILNIFYEKEEKPKLKPAPSTQPSETATGWSQHVQKPSDGLIDQFRDQFNKILDDENKRNFPGNDYYEFIVMKNAMSAIPQEAVKYQAAFAGWATGGNQNRDTLLKTADVYLGLVRKEIDDFEQAYKTEHTNQIAKTQDLLQQKKTQIADLKQKLADLTQESIGLEQQISAGVSVLEAKHDAFAQAGQEKLSEIAGEIQKIKQYIN
jgi:hypothetical protein